MDQGIERGLEKNRAAFSPRPHLLVWVAEKAGTDHRRGAYIIVLTWLVAYHSSSKVHFLKTNQHLRPGRFATFKHKTAELYES